MEEVKKIALDIKKGDVKPIYLLMGEEAFYIDKLSDYIPSQVLAEHEMAFNKVVLYGKDCKMVDVINQSKQYPMGSDRQVVVVKEAQHLTRDFEEITAYANHPQPTTVLILCYKYKKVDKRKASYKALQKTACILETKKLYENQIPNWIRTSVQNRGYHCAPIAAHLLAEYLGSDLSKIDKEIEKLTLVIEKGAEITPDLIEKHIGISKDFNNFELKKALGERNIQKTLNIIQYFYQNPKENPFVVTLGVLHNFFSQLMQYHTLSDHKPSHVASQLGISPYFVEEYTVAARNYPLKKVSQILATLRELDVKGKGVESGNMSHADLLKEMVYKII